MRYVVLFVAGAIALCVYMAMCWLLLLYVIAPAAVVVAAVAVAAGAVTALVAAMRVLWGGYRFTSIRKPIDVANSPSPYVRRDYAWPQYFAAQVKLDLDALLRQLRVALAHAWADPVKVVRRLDYRIPLAGWPLLVPVLVAAAGYTVGIFVLAACVVLVGGLITGACWALGLAAVGLLRGLDRAWQLARRAGGTCPRCYEVSLRPAYQCPGPHPVLDRQGQRDLHRDLRPGRLGVLWRRCGCGQRLPTTVLRAAAKLQARCPLCLEPLPPGAAAQTDVRIPVFGAVSAGKTHLVMATVLAMLRGSGVDTADGHSARTVAGYRSIVERGGSAPKTDASQPPVAVTLELRNGRRRAFVHLFDAAGEALADRDQNHELAYLDRARTLAFVLDPFSIQELRDQFGVVRADLFTRANPAREAPEDAYVATVSRLRDHGVDTGRQRLAFVLSKQDLLDQLLGGAAPPPDHDALRGWLLDQQLDNLVTLAERDFRAVRYFLVSADRAAAAGSVTAPFRWLLRGERLTLPEPG